MKRPVDPLLTPPAQPATPATIRFVAVCELCSFEGRPHRDNLQAVADFDQHALTLTHQTEVWKLNERARSALIASAAEAVEVYGDDELEAHAADLHARGVL